AITGDEDHELCGGGLRSYEAHLAESSESDKWRPLGCRAARGEMQAKNQGRGRQTAEAGRKKTHITALDVRRPEQKEISKTKKRGQESFPAGEVHRRRICRK